MLKRFINGVGSEYASIGFHFSTEDWFQILVSEDRVGVIAPDSESVSAAILYHIVVI